ncbi:nitroreductase/quinone reductase family protein [Pseudonocardia sp. HH130630-07]|uniref:nitroreductase/quinone reductase family protein n=1 Tax=Pseudonocardia sp. HH130630-07 TaxID=1690815 RepID=UPI000814F976|nr:nitroreductase/quinone reductase family protein [Pseudonocardia sp. HH130630-07]ANY05662.1 hypothetical protein AFB00_04360 [Pseudonocardia sp. HH130630-07]
MSDRPYRPPGVFSRRILNPLVGALATRGVLPGGTVVLAVAGRVSGEIRSVPLTPFTADGRRCLVSPRGDTDWVRNLRASGGAAELRSGGGPERIRAVELDRAGAVPVLRSYLRGLGRSAGLLFPGLSDTASDEEITAAAHRHPVFEVTARS